MPAPTSAALYVIAKEGFAWAAANGYGIFRSADNGVTWDVTLPLWLEPVELEDP
jgi:hypothetical protein